ncbi:hypothetical protein GCM10029963_25910 [Micromonospora andamanensis]
MGDEVVQHPIGTDHAERAVAGAGQVAGCLHDAPQGAAQIQVGADADDRVEQCPQPFPAGDHLADAIQHLLEQLVQADSGQRAEAERRWLVPGVGCTDGHPAMLTGGWRRGNGPRSAGR